MQLSSTIFTFGTAIVYNLMVSMLEELKPMFKMLEYVTEYVFNMNPNVEKYMLARHNIFKHFKSYHQVLQDNNNKKM